MEQLSKSTTVKQDHNCSVCLTVFLDPVCLKKCKHIFCQRCIQDSYQLSGVKRCPLCRTLFKENQLVDMNDFKIQLQTLYPKALQEKRKMIPIKRKIKLLIGNTTKFLQTQEDNKFDWKFFIKQAAGQQKLGTLANKVEVHLHPTFRPPIVTYSTIPQQGVQLNRLGWGTFEINAKIFWKKQLGGGISQLSHYLQWQPKVQKEVICHVLIPNK